MLAAVLLHRCGALPLQACGASLCHVSDLRLQDVHHHPVPCRSREWPPWALGLAVSLPLLAAVWCMAAALAFFFSAAAWAALALDASVSLAGSPG